MGKGESRGVHNGTNGEKREISGQKREQKREDNGSRRSIIRIDVVKEYITPIKIDISDD